MDFYILRNLEDSIAFPVVEEIVVGAEEEVGDVEEKVNAPPMPLIPEELEQEEDEEEVEEDEEKEEELEEEIEDDQPNNVHYHFVQNVAVRRPYSRSPSRSLSPNEDTSEDEPEIDHDFLASQMASERRRLRARRERQVRRDAEIFVEGMEFDLDQEERYRVIQNYVEEFHQNQAEDTSEDDNGENV
ncbi:hypothetical protein GCK72_022789 [Caenorhabditis remanei]|uniref:Uncharacterized protein n=1 Tax=Caenorhabditis remanei TaxID=31234 RepID=A0A6A5FUZ3_CAERE|nr:hypothetical protein GCK72_022789 [Caenorhabditis remanei]KAF1746336.1 hypothetical protein GCK72_022789 [Caenorhabditis remanei]